MSRHLDAHSILEYDFPIELHIPGYNYCGPFTKLNKKLVFNKNGDVVKVLVNPINEVDYQCMLHDIAYMKYRSKYNRVLSDMALLENVSGRKIPKHLRSTAGLVYNIISMINKK